VKAVKAWRLSPLAGGILIRAIGSWIMVCAMLVFGLPAPTRAQTLLRPESLRVIEGTALEQQYQEMLLKFLLQQAAELTEKRRNRLNEINTETDFRRWQETNRETFLRLIGGLPEIAGQPGQKPPLHARLVGQVERQGYSLRKVIYESLPEFYVTANLYVPTASPGVKPPYPAVLAFCGHSENGKAYELYQHLFIGLARRGYVVLVYDPIGQGERVQYWDFAHRHTLLPNPDDQHAMAGIQEYLLGEDLARFLIWDGVRGIDYLVSLPEVDATRIGVTGSSGGGTLTTYVSMLDARVKVAAPVTFISSIPKKIEARVNDADADPEQDIPGLLAEGIDHTEFLGMIAPRPVLIGAATRDFFPIEGTHRTFQEVQELYRKLGVPDRVKLVEFNQQHMFSQPLREAVEAWFDRWLKGAPDDVHEAASVVEKASVLECTPTGQVLTSLGGNRVYNYNRAQAAELMANLELKRSDQSRFTNEQSNERVDLLTKIWDRLAPAGTKPEPHPQKVEEIEVGNLVIEKLLIESEPGIVVPTRVISLKGESRHSSALVYLRNRAGDHDDPSLYAEIAQRHGVVAVADVRGFGETMSRQRVPGSQLNYFDPRDGLDADFAYGSFFVGRTLLGMRVWDALNVVEYMHSRSQVGAVRVSIAGRGDAGLVALFAAALDANVSGAAAEGVPASYGEIAESETYDQPVTFLLPGALHDFDLADVLALITPRPLLLVNVQDAGARTMTLNQARRSLDAVVRAYQATQAVNRLGIKTAQVEPEVRVLFTDWASRY
jgi:cephalosporin-C deacetylase-like acetyl esterase